MCNGLLIFTLKGGFYGCVQEMEAWSLSLEFVSKKFRCSGFQDFYECFEFFFSKKHKNLKKFYKDAESRENYFSPG